MSVFLGTNHLFLRNPRGGVEDIAAMARAGFGAIFCNIGDHEPSEWAVIRKRAADNNIVCGPWLRTAEGNNVFSRMRLDFLIAVADSWRSPLIVNVESEIKGSGSGLTEFIASRVGDRDAGISVEAWPFANVAWYPLKKYPILPQIFPAESPVAKDPEACRQEWYKYGVNCVVYTFGAYGIQHSGMYEKLTPYGVYTADDCGGYYHAWSAQGRYASPCKEGEEEGPGEGEGTMELIGSQHGVTGFVNWLRTQPGVPVRGPGYKPEDINTWPWPDKIERSLKILCQDHDAAINRELQNKASTRSLGNEGNDV